MRNLVCIKSTLATRKTLLASQLCCEKCSTLQYTLSKHQNMVDSTTNEDNTFLRSWSSCETVVDVDLLYKRCDICQRTTCILKDSNLHGQRVIILKSVVHLLCACESTVHLHCWFNQIQQSVEELSLAIREPSYECARCHVSEEEAEGRSQ